MSDTTKKAPKFKFHYAWLIFIGCCCMMAGGLAAVLNSSGLFYVAVCGELGFARSELALYLSFYLISMVVATPVVGNLLPRVNIRILMTCMFIIVCIAEGMMGTYHYLWQFYLSGAIFGLCGSFIFILPTPLLIGNWFKKRTGLILGLAMSFSGIGTAIFAQLFTYFITTFGWRNTYVIVAIIMAVLVLPWTMFVFRYRPADMGLLPYGVDEDTHIEETTEVVGEKKTILESIPGVPVRAAVLSVPFVCIFILSGCEEYFGGVTNQIPAFADSIGKGLAFGASLLSVISIGNIVIKIGAGYLADKIGIIKTVYIQMLLVAVACAIFMVVRVDWALYAAALCLGVQNSVVTVSEPLLVRYFFGERSYAQVYSYIRIAAGILGAVGMPLVALIFDTTGAYTLAFVIGICIAVFLAILTFIAQRNKHRLAWED